MVKITRKVTIATTQFADYQISLIEKRTVNEDNMNQIFDVKYVIRLDYKVCDTSSFKYRKAIEKTINNKQSGSILLKERQKYKSIFRKIDLFSLFESGYTINQPERLFDKVRSLMLQ